GITLDGGKCWRRECGDTFVTCRCRRCGPVPDRRSPLGPKRETLPSSRVAWPGDQATTRETKPQRASYKLAPTLLATCRGSAVREGGRRAAGPTAPLASGN